MRDLLRPLYSPRTKQFWLYVPLAAVVAAAGSLAILFTVNHFTDWLGPEVEGPSIAISWGELFGLVIFAPVVETALLLLTLRLFQWTRPPYSAALASLVWGGLHALIYPVWFFGTVWSFFVFACAALAWHQKSPKHAFFAAALPHADINSSTYDFPVFYSDPKIAVVDLISVYFNDTKMRQIFRIEGVLWRTTNQVLNIVKVGA